MPDDLLYRAGPRALARIRRDGFQVAAVRAYVGPASGPRWLVLSSIDRVVVEHGLLDCTADRPPIQLAGASAGAWRMLALACDEPVDTLAHLEELYITQVFNRKDSAETVSTVYRSMFDELLSPALMSSILDNPRARLAIITTKVIGFLGNPSRPLQMAAFAAGAGLRFLSRAASRPLFRRVVFHSSPESLTVPIQGDLVRLTADNLVDAALASGSVPLAMSAVRDIAKAPSGAYLDGGLTDYHLNHQWTAPDSGLVLFPHFQESILPGWFDRYRPSRRPAPAILADVLQIAPTPTFVSRLPGGKIPDRSDFYTHMDDPEERIRRWREATLVARTLGDSFRNDIERGRIPNLVHAIDGSA